MVADDDAEAALSVHRARNSYVWNLRYVGFMFVLGLGLTILAGWTGGEGSWGVAIGCAVLAAIAIVVGVVVLREVRTAEETLAQLGAQIPTEKEWLPGGAAGALLSGLVAIVVAALE